MNAILLDVDGLVGVAAENAIGIVLPGELQSSRGNLRRHSKPACVQPVDQPRHGIALEVQFLELKIKRRAQRVQPDTAYLETIELALTAASTGHLVFGTLHTTGAVKTIDRIIDALPVEEREQTKSFLAQSLLAVITQILVKSADARGRRALCEIMVMTKAIAKLIQTDQTHQIPTQLQTGRDFGMQMLDQALLAAITAKEIDPDDAYAYATEKRLFQKYVTDTSILPKLDASAATTRIGPGLTPPAAS